MLKKFFLNTLSSFAGAWLAFALISISSVLFIIAMMANLSITTEETSYSLKKGSLFVIDLSGAMEERVANEAPDVMSLVYGNKTTVRSLEVYTGAIEEAAENNDVGAILLLCNGLEASPASLHALRESLLKCKANGKPIYAYGNSMTQGDYYLASISENIYLNPQGALDLHGVGGYTPYFKDLLDKVGVQMQIVKVGTFKSAVEPYILNEMSEPARAQLDTLYNAIWSQIKDEISISRKIKPTEIDSLINRDYILVKTPELALKSGLIDGTLYQHQMEDKLATALNKKKFEDVNIVDVNYMYDQYLKHKKNKGDQIAILYAYGEIDGGETGGIQSNDLVPLIFKLSENDDIAALVLRVNSPGGSAFGSEQIWEALEQFKLSGKKFVVSMGDYAASGGYYISCGADKIYADPMTITGSIGIFGMIPCVNELLDDKLGVHMQLVSTNPAGNINMFEPMTEQQHNAMQSMVESGYDLFTSRVAEGRKMPQDKVKTIGEGRVWDAVTAKKIGLVDELGSLQDAVECAARLAKCNKYYTVAYPEANPGFWTLINEANIKSMVMSTYMTQEEQLLLLQAKQIMGRKPLQARMQDMIIRL